MTNRAVPRVLAVTLVAALLPITSAQALTSSPEGTVTGAGRHASPFVSAPFKAGKTSKPLKAMSHKPSATRTDPGEGLGRGRMTATTTTKGPKDPALQTSAIPSGTGSRTSGEAAQELTSPLVSFAGQTSPFSPPDPNGDVGPNHYVQTVNAQIQIWDKQGNSLAGPTNLNQLWINGTTAGTGFDQCRTQNAGDPIVLYDQQADRFMVSQFTNPNSATGPGGTFPMCIAYSQTGDPTQNWFLYQFNLPRSHDYMKYGIWPDGLYMSTYEGGAVGAYVFDRAQMLSGSPATFQSFSVPVGGGVDGRERRIVPADWDGADPPPAGAPNPFAMSFDGAFDGGNDRIEIRSFHVDWATPANTTFTLTDTLDTAAFDTDLSCSPTFRDCIPQRGTTQKVDGITNRLMARLQYRNFADHQSMVINQTVDADGNNRAGVRWYELRNTGSGWSIFQQGTYAPVDGVHRWMAAAAMDGRGDIALGYSASDGTNTFPSLRYTARNVNDAAGSMPQGEQTLTSGTTSQTGSNRWGDYSGLVVDPVDDCTFWLTGMHDNGLTTIGSFRLPSCLQSDLRITKADAPDPVIAGQDLTYTLTVTNDGPATAQNVSVTDVLPAGTTLVSAPGCTNAAGTLTCAVGTVLSAQSVVIAIQIHLPSGFLGNAASGLITNTASVAAANQADPTPGNNTATATTTVVARADLAVTKVCKPDGSAPAGTTAFCDIHVDNLGPSDAVGVTLTDVLTSATPFTVTGVTVTPSGTCLPTSGGPATSFTTTCDLGVEPSGGRTTIRVSVTASDVAEVNDVATVTSATPDPNTANNQATGRLVFTGSADLAVTKTGPASVVAGMPIQYVLTVTNNGPSQAVSAVVTDRLPAVVTFVSVSPSVGTCTFGQPTAHDLTCNLGNLAAGAVVTVTVNGTVAPDVAPGTIIVNEAVVSSATADPNNADNRVSVPTNVTAQADLRVTKADSPDPVLAGNLLTWTITATNGGPSTATSVLLTDTLPAGVTFVAGVNNNGQTVCTLVQTGTVECAAGTLQPGQTAVVQLTVRVAASVPQGTVLHNSVTVSSATPDPAPGNNTATQDTTVNTQADVWLDKQATKRSGNPSPTLVYTLVVHNDTGCETDAQSTQTPTCGTGGPSDARNIVVTDALPLTNKKLVVQFVSPQCVYTSSTHTVRCTSANVPAGATVTFVIEAQVSGSVGTVLNTASVTSSTPDPVTANNTNAASIVMKGGTGK
ncbi:hypothetical protein GCM10027053_24450 [Intrasporangium mesophilum]